MRRYSGIAHVQAVAFLLEAELFGNGGEQFRLLIVMLQQRPQGNAHLPEQAEP